MKLDTTAQEIFYVMSLLDSIPEVACEVISSPVGSLFNGALSMANHPFICFVGVRKLVCPSTHL